MTCGAVYRVNAVEEARFPRSIFVRPDQCFLFYWKLDTKLALLSIHAFLSTSNQLFIFIFLPTTTYITNTANDCSVETIAKNFQAIVAFVILTIKTTFRFGLQ